METIIHPRIGGKVCRKPPKKEAFGPWFAAIFPKEKANDCNHTILHEQPARLLDFWDPGNL